MDIEVYTSDPDSVHAEELLTALEDAGYLVGEVTVRSRATGEVVSFIGAVRETGEDES
jgi:hypothetical protein